MFDFFNNFKSLYYFAHFDLFAIKNIFMYYNFFFNMHLNKHIFKKIYFLYKNVHLSEFLCKYYYPFEIHYFIININTLEILFDSFYYYYPVVFFFKYFYFFC